MVDRRILLRNSMEQFRCIKNAPINNPDQVTHKSVEKENQKAWLENARKSLKEALVSAEKYRLEKGLKNNPTPSSAHHNTAKENVLAVPRRRFLPTSKDRVPALASVAGNLPVSTSAKAPNQDATIPELDMAGFPSRMTENSAATDATTKSNENNSQASSCAEATTSLARKQQQARPFKVTKSSIKHSLKRRLKQVNILERVAVKTLSFTRRRRSSATTEVRNRSKVPRHSDKGKLVPVASRCSDNSASADKRLPVDGERRLEEDYTVVIVEDESDLAEFFDGGAEEDAGMSVRKPEATASGSSVHTDTTQRSQVESEDQTRRVTRSMSAKIAIPRAPVKASYRAKVGDKAKPCDGVREDRTIVFVANANNVGPFSSGSAQANFSGVSIVIQPVVTVAPPAIVGNTIIAGAEQGLQCFSLCRYESATGRLGVAESAVTKLPLHSISGLSSCFQNMSLSSGLITLGAGVTAAPPAPSAGKSDTALQDLQPAECNSASQGMDVPADSVSGKSEDDSGESFTVQTLEQLVKSLGINEYVQSPAVTPSTYALASCDSLVGGTEGLLAQDSSAAQRDEDCAESVESSGSIGCGIIKLAQEPDAAALCASVYPNQAPETNPEPQPSSGHQPRTNAKDKPAENGTVKEPLASDFIQGEACLKNVELSDEDDDDCVIVGVSYPNIAEFYNTSYQVAQTVHTITQTSDAVTPLAESSSHLSAKPGQLFLDCQPNCGEKDLSEAGFVQEEGSLKTAESTMTLSKDYTTAGVGDTSRVAGAAVSTVDTSNYYSTAVGERDAVTASTSPASETAQDLHLAWQGQPGSISETDSTALSSSVPCKDLTVTRRKDGVAESSDNVDLSPSISTTTESNAVTSGARNSSIPVADMEEDVESHKQCAPATIAKGSALENATAMHLSKDYVQELGCPKTVQPLNIEEKDSTSYAESVETDIAECFNIDNVEHDSSTALPEPNEAKSHAEDEQGLVVEAEQGLELYRDCPPEANANNNAPEDCTPTKLLKGGCVEELGNSNDVEPFSSTDNGIVTVAGVDRNAAEPLDTVVEGNRGFSSAMHGSDQCHIMSYNDQITTTALELPLYGHCLPEPVTRIDFTEDVAAEESSESDSTKVFSTLKPLDPFNTEAHITQYFQNVVGVDLGHNTVTEAPKVVASCDEYDSSTDTMTGCRLQVQTQCQAETVAITNSLEDIMTEQFSEDDCGEEPGTLETEPLNSAREVTTSESTANFPEDTVARRFGYSAVTEVPKVVALCDKRDSSTDTIRLQVHTQCQAETVARTNSFEDTITEQLSEDQCVEEPGTLETEPLNREDVTIAESVAVVVRSNSPEDTVTKQLSEGDCTEEPETPDTEPLNSADDASIAESIDSDSVELVDGVTADLRGSAVFQEPSIPALSAAGVDSLLLETAQELYPLWQGPLETTTKYASSGDGVMQEPSDHDCIHKVCSVGNVEPSDSVNKDNLTALEKECVYDRSFCQKVNSSKNDEFTPAEEERGDTKWACADQSVGTITQVPQNETGVAEDGSNLIEKTNEEVKLCSQCPLETSPASNLPEDSVATEFLESDCIQEKTVNPLIIASRDSVAIPDGNKNGASEPFSDAFDVNCGSSTVIPDLVIASTGNDSCVPTETGQQSQSHEPRPAKTRAETRPCENTAAKRLLESDHIRELNRLETVGVLNCPTEDPRTVAEEQEEDLAESSKNAVKVHEDFSTVTRELEVKMSLASASEDLTSDTTPELILQSPPGTITRSNSPEDVMEEPSCGDRSLEAIALNEAKDMSSEHDHAVEDAVSDSVMREPSQDDRSLEVGAFVEVGDSSCGTYTVAGDGGASKTSNDGINARQFCSVAQQPGVATLPAKNSRSSSQTSEMGEDTPIQRHCHPDVNKQDLETTGPLNSGKEDKAVMEDHQKAVDVDDLTSPMLDSGTETSLVTGVCSLASEIAPESCFGCPARTIAKRNFPENDITEEPSQSDRGEEVGCVKKVNSLSSENYSVVKDTVSELSNCTVDIADSVSVVKEPGTATLPSRQTETEKSLFWLMPFRSSKSGSPTVEAGQEPVFCGQQTNARGDHNEATVTAEPSKQEVVRKFCFTNVKCVVVASSLGCDSSTIVGDDDGSAETPSEDVEVDCSVGNNVRELGLTSHFKDGDNLISESLPGSELCRPREPETVVGNKSDENTFVKQLSDGDCVKEPCSFKALEPLSINEKCVTVTESDQSEPSMSFNNSDGISINETSTTATERDQKEASNSFNYSAGITCAWNSVALDLNTKPSCDNHSPITRAGQELQSCQECSEAIKESVLSQDPGMSEESKSEASESFKDSAGVTCGLNSTVLDVDATASSDNCSPVARTGQELQSCQGCPEAIKESVLSQDPGMSEESKSEASESFDDSADVTCDLNSTVLDVDATASGDSCSPVARTGQGLQLFQECPKAIKESVHSQDPGMSEESKSEASESFKDSAGVTCDFNSTVLDADATASGDNCSPIARTGKELQSCQECPEATMEGVVSQDAGMSEESKSEASQSFKDSAGTTCDLNSTVLDVDATALSGNCNPIARTEQELQSCQECPEAITESVFSQDAGMSEESKSEASRSFKDSAGITYGLNSTVLDVDATTSGDNCSPITRTRQELQSCQECPDPITESVLSEDAAVSEQSKRYLIQEPVGFENVRSSSSMNENGSLVADNVDGHVISFIDGTGVGQSICLPEPDAASHALDRSRAILEASQGLQSQTPCQREKNTTGNGSLEDFSPEELSRSESVEEVLSCQPETNRPRKDAFTGELSRSESVEEVWNDWPETMKENRSFEGALTRGLSRIGSAGQFVGSDNVKPAEHFRIAGKDCVAMARRERKPCGTLSNSSDVNCGVDGAIARHPNSGTSRLRPDLGSASGQERKKRRDDRKHQRTKFAAWRSDPPADAATKCPPQKDYSEGVRVCFDYSNNLHVTVAPRVGTKFAQLSDRVAEANCVANPLTEESDATSLCAGSGSGAVSGAESDSQRHRPIRIAKRRSPKAAATKDPSNHDCAAGPSGHSKTTAPLEVFSGAVYEPHMGRHVIEKEIVPDSQDFGVSAVRYRISWLPAQFL